VEKKKDKDKFDAAWREHQSGRQGRFFHNVLLKKAREAALEFDETPRQGKHLLTIDDMMAEARELEDEMHALVQEFIEKAGGRWKQGPLKLEERVRTKTEVGRGYGPRSRPQPLSLRLSASASQPLSLSASQPLSLSASQPLSLSASQPLSLSASQPPRHPPRPLSR
jgi:hypothetical protein